MDYNVIYSPILSREYDKRYVVVDKEGNLLDDAQGYGYKSIRNAHAAFRYKNRDKSKDAEKRKREEEVFSWMRKHKEFIGLMEEIAFECAKGSYGGPFNASVVKDLLKQNGYTDVPFTPGFLLRCWQKGEKR